MRTEEIRSLLKVDLSIGDGIIQVNGYAGPSTMDRLIQLKYYAEM